MKLTSLAFVAATTLAGGATAQPATFSIFGTPCSTSEGTPTLTHTGLPVLGQSFDVHYRGPNRVGGVYFYQPHLVLGFRPISPGVTIPQGLFPGQPPGCSLYTTHDLVVPMPLSPIVRPAYESTFTFNIPNLPILSGGTFFVQWITVYTQCGIVPPCWVTWIATSDAGVATIGT